MPRTNATNRSSSSAVSPRPRVGGRYRNTNNTNNNINDDSSAAANEWGKLIYPGGPKLWCRLVTAFAIMALFGAMFLVLGAVFLENAREIHEDSGISLPVIWCIIGMVCGTLMIVGSLVLGKKMISSKWRTNAQPEYSSRSRSAETRHTNDEGSNVTYPPGSASHSETFQASDNSLSGSATTEQLDLPPPAYHQPDVELRYSRSSQFPPAAVFIISQGDVNLAIPAVVGNTQLHNIHSLSPPKYSTLGMLDPPIYSEKDPLKPPNYEDTLESSVIAGNTTVVGVENGVLVCSADSVGGTSPFNATSAEGVCNSIIISSNSVQTCVDETEGDIEDGTYRNHEVIGNAQGDIDHSDTTTNNNSVRVGVPQGAISNPSTLTTNIGASVRKSHIPEVNNDVNNAVAFNNNITSDLRSVISQRVLVQQVPNNDDAIPSDN